MRSLILFISLLISTLGISQTVSFSSDTVCIGEHMTLTTTSTPVDSILGWEWDMDGDLSFDDANGPLVNYLFPSDGSYTVYHRIILNNGDTLTTFKDVVVNSILSPVFTWNRACQNEEMNFEASVVESYSGTIYYDWDFNSDNDYNDTIGDIVTYSFDDFGVTNIKLRVTTDMGCVSVLTDQVIVDPLPNSNFIYSNNCYGDSTLFQQTSTIASGSIVDFSWDINNDNNFTDLNGETVSYQYFSPGNYSVSLRSESNNGCIDDTTIFFGVSPRPQALFTLSNQCEEIQVNIDNLSDSEVGSISYEWDFGDGDVSNSENPEKSYVDPGIYEVLLVVNSNFGCSDSLIKEVEIFEKPSSLFTINDLCFGDKTDIENYSSTNSGIIVSYEWDFDDGLGSVSFTPEHEYSSPDFYDVSLIVEDSYGCRDTSVQQIEVIQNPSISIFNHNESWYCENDSVRLSVYPESDEIAIWSNGTVDSYTYFDYPGLHHVTVYDQFGCSSEDSILIEEISLPIVDAGVDFSLNAGETVFLNGSGTFEPQWIFGDFIDNPFVWKPTVQPATSSNYILQATNEFGCQNFDTVFVSVAKDYVLDPTNLLSPNGDGNNDTWIVRNIEAYDDCEVVIFNRWGQEVYRSRPYQNDWDGTFNNEQLPEGAYYYTVKCGGSVKVYSGDISLIRSND